MGIIINHKSDLVGGDREAHPRHHGPKRRKAAYRGVRSRCCSLQARLVGSANGRLFLKQAVYAKIGQGMGNLVN